MKAKVPLDEQETVINYSPYHIGEWAEVYTTDKVVMKRYKKFCTAHPEHCRLIKEDDYSMTFSVNPKCASVYPKAPRKVVMTEEKKEIYRERLAKLRTQK